MSFVAKATESPPGCLTGYIEAIIAAAVGMVVALIGGIVKAPFRVAGVSVTVRPGKPNEVIGVRHRVLRVGQPRESAIFEGDREADSRHWVAEDDGVVVGVVTVIRRPMPGGSEPHWQLRGMAVDEHLRSHGVGASILQTVHSDVAEPMWCNARVGAAGFYEKHGWAAVGDDFDIEPMGPHRRMRWAP